MIVYSRRIENPASNVMHSFNPAIHTISVFMFTCFCSYFVPAYCGSNGKVWFVNKTGVPASLCYSGPPLLLMYCERAISHMLGVSAWADTADSGNKIVVECKNQKLPARNSDPTDTTQSWCDT